MLLSYVIVRHTDTQKKKCCTCLHLELEGNKNGNNVLRDSKIFPPEVQINWRLI